MENCKISVVVKHIRQTRKHKVSVHQNAFRVSAIELSCPLDVERKISIEPSV